MKTRICIITFLLFITSVLPCFADIVYTQEAEISVNYTVTAMHGRGSWSVNGPGLSLKVSDTAAEKAGGLASYLNSLKLSHDFSVTVPEKIRVSMEMGNEYRADPESSGSVFFSDIFLADYEDSSKLSSSAYKVRLTLKFNTVAGIDHKTFISGLTASVPLVDTKYGSNIYLVYGNGLSGLTSRGSFYPSSPSKITSGRLHPSLIEDRSGKLKDGFIFSASGHSLSSDGMSVGKGDFLSSGSCGLEFRFPFKVVFKRIDDIDGITKINAAFLLPETAQTGETVTAMDKSIFTYHGAEYTSDIIYSKGLASCRFISDGTKADSGPGSCSFVFTEAGMHTVKLLVSTPYGNTGSCEKTILITGPGDTDTPAQAEETDEKEEIDHQKDPVPQDSAETEDEPAPAHQEETEIAEIPAEPVPEPEMINSLSLEVCHTKKWEQNRQAFNAEHFNEGGASYKSVRLEDYKQENSPRKRAAEVFWPGEKIIIKINTEGLLLSCRAELSGTPYSVELPSSAMSHSNSPQTYTMELWDKKMIETLMSPEPKAFTVKITAVFEKVSSTETLVQNAEIIFDQDIGYLQLHRSN